MSKTKTAEELTEEKNQGNGKKRIRDIKRQEKAVAMASEGIEASEIAQKLEYAGKSIVLNIMKKNHIATRSKVAELLETEPDNAIIAKQANWKIEAVEKYREERNEENKNKRSKRAVEMASEGMKARDIAKKLGYAREISVLKLMRRNNIATRRQVDKLLKAGLDNDTIVSQTNWKIEAVEKFRKEKENEGKNKTRSERREKVIEMAAEGIEVKEIAQRLGYASQRGVHALMRGNNIATRSKVAELLETEPDDDIIASQTNWKKEAVEKFRKEKIVERQSRKIELNEKEKREKQIEQIIRKLVALNFEDEEIAEQLRL